MIDPRFRIGRAVMASIVLTVLAPVPARAQTVLAVCTDPKGRGFETTPAKGWVFSRLKNTTLMFTRDRAGKPDILIRDRARSVSLARDGAKLKVTHHSRDYSYFIITAVYQQAQVDTFQVTYLPNGIGRLVWTSVRSHLPPKDETRATFLVAECSR